MKKLLLLTITLFSIIGYTQTDSLACSTIRDFGATGRFGTTIKDQTIEYNISGMSLRINSDEIPSSNTITVDSAEFSIHKDTCESVNGCHVESLNIQISIFDRSTETFFTINEHITDVHFSLESGSRPQQLPGLMFKIYNSEGDVYLEAFIGRCR